ncbi:MAG: MoxR family ATPase [Bacteroidota bacterium]
MENEMQMNNRLDLSKISHAVDRIKAEIRKIIVGQDEMIELLLTALLAEGHVIIEGVPGTAKTLTAKLLAKTIQCPFSRIQFTPDLMPSDILGTSIYNFKSSEFEFKKGPIFSNIILIDEINRSPAKTQAALFEVMEERQITIDGTTKKLDAPFFVVATQNPIEQEGTYRLPEAQLDRFLFKIEVHYPSLEQEVNIIENHHQSLRINDLTNVMAVINAQDIIENQQLCRHVVVESKLIQFIAQLIHKSRNMPELYLGASTRASISILNAAKAFAILKGRDFVTPDDIIFVAKPILRHRIILTPEKEMEGIGPNEIIDQLIKSVEIPR